MISHWCIGIKKLTRVESESIEFCDQEIVSCAKLKSALNVAMSAIEHIGYSVGIRT